jgi:plastocyanin
MAFRVDFSVRCCTFIRAPVAVVHVEMPAHRLEVAMPEPTDIDRSRDGVVTARRRLGRVPTLALALLVPLAALATVAVTLLVTDDPTTSAAAAPGTHASGTAIAIENFRFSPDPITVKAGTTVTVTNRDGTVHTLTADDGGFDTGDLDGGATATITLAAPGTHRYFCDVHNYMTGTIEVR